MTLDAGTRRRLEPDARREQILAVAVRLFGERGGSEVSTTDVAREAGVARGLINHYFGTRKDLYLEVLRVMLTVPPAAVARLPAGDLDTRIDAIVTWFLDVVSHHSRSWLAAITAGGTTGDPDAEQAVAAAIDVAADSVLDALGFARPDPARQAIARAYVGLAISTAREWLQREVLTRDQVHQLLTEVLRTVAVRVLRSDVSAPE